MEGFIDSIWRDLNSMKRISPLYLYKRLKVPLFLIFTLIIPFATQAENLTPANVDQQGMFAKIQHYAQLSSVVYKDPITVKATSRELGYEENSFAEIAGTKVSYLLATNPTSKTHVIAVRGTSNVENVIIDTSVKLTHDEQLDIYLHEGFAASALGIYNTIKPQLNKTYKISTTGHSLGGAVALILAMYLDNDHYNVERVVTFGQPKVTNIPGALKFDHINILRVVTPKDMVPLVPPFDPVDINNLDIYWHVGTEVILLKDHDYSMVKGVKSMMRATKFMTVQPGEENIRHHQMSLYLDLIKAKLESAILIPYENDFSFINRFFGN